MNRVKVMNDGRHTDKEYLLRFSSDNVMSVQLQLQKVNLY